MDNIVEHLGGAGVLLMVSEPLPSLRWGGEACTSP